MSTYSAFRTDDALETKGIVLDFGSAGKIRIARAGGANTNYQKKLATLSKPHRRAIQAGVLDEATAAEIVTEAYADTIVLGWEGVTGPDGKDLPFTKENVKQLFADLPDLFAEVKKASLEAALYRAELNEDDAKN